ncbi:MAG: T9SS type A sorting domain-containing protein [Flavobacteriales bacterium]|nr:T9SS type A sorting domain-containing protein [Flavobacteriales bacterium]
MCSEVFADVPVNGSSLNPEKISLNISAVAGGASSVFVRFHWTGTWAYTWFVDDVAIVEQPQYDLIMNYSFLSHTGNGEEYGRVPSAQFYPEMNVGAEILNFGVLPQGNVTVDMEVRDDANNVVFTSSQLLGTMNSGDRDTMDQQVTLPALAEGTYKATTVVTSLESSNDGSPDNNTSVRYFAVDNGLYATDLIGVDTNAIVNALGSESFTDAEDGLYLLSYYEVRQDMPVAGVELIITSTSTAGAQVIVSLHDTATVNQDDIGSPIVESVSYTVTAADVAAQTVQVLFSGLETLPVGGYYAAALLLSNNNTFPIAVFDDITVPQPGLMGGIHILGDATYSNGNAIAVRAITDPSISVAEQDGLDGVQMYPNPSVDGLVRVVSVLSGISTVEVTNAMGEIVLSDRFTGSTTLNLSGAAKGVYMVRISNEEGSMVQRIVRN